MESKNKKIVMFDFDGVLIDTLIPCYTINTEINEDLSLEEYKSFFTGNIHDAIRKNGEPRKRHPEFEQKYDICVREIKIPDILKDAVKYLASLYTLTIVSSTYSNSIHEILLREGIAEYFTDVLGADVDPSKVVKIKMLLEKHHSDPHDCVFVTDTLGDIREAHKCSVPSVAVTWGFHTKEDLQKGEPVVFIYDPKDFVLTIKNVLK
jgi:phosphoglycolate phosphatase